MIWSIDYDSETSATNPSSEPAHGGNGDGGNTCFDCKSKWKPNAWDMFDPQDFSSVKRLAAIGDSYSAGIGAGNRLGSIFDAWDEGNGKRRSFFGGVMVSLI